MEQKPTMINLPSHSFFEQLMGRGEPTEEALPHIAAIYFTATWCKKCKTIDLNKVMTAIPSATWYKNDIDENENSYAYASLRSIPSFVVIKDKKYMGKFDKETAGKEGVSEETIMNWLKQFI
jgi:thiol-disulfide isomerase/thioredoxin